MAALRNEKKLAASNEENYEEHPRSNLAQNSKVPRAQEDYITDVSEEIEERVTKKLSREFSRTENRILGALALLDVFLMNPLIQSHSRTAPERSQNASSTSQSSNKTTPRVIVILNQPSSTGRWRKTVAQKIATTWWQEFTKNSHTAPPIHIHESKKRTALPVNRNSAVKTTLQRLKQTNNWWPFSSVQTTTTLQSSITVSKKFPICHSPSRQRCQRSLRNLRNLSCWNVFSKRAPKFIINWLKMKESTTFILSWGEMPYKDLKRIMAQPEKTWQFSKDMRKTLIDGDNETQIPETWLQSSESEVSIFSSWTSKISQRRIRNSCRRHDRTIHIRPNPTTPEGIKKPGSPREWHNRTDCYIPRQGFTVERFRSPWWATYNYCEPQYCKHKCWQTKSNVPSM